MTVPVNMAPVQAISMKSVFSVLALSLAALGLVSLQPCLAVEEGSPCNVENSGYYACSNNLYDVVRIIAQCIPTQPTF